jgi:hypothetical protein
MAQMSANTSKAYVRGYYIFCLVLILFFLAPALMDRYYPEAPALARATVGWFRDTLSRGFAALTFLAAIYNICSLSSDAYKWLSGLRSASPATGPIALEDGTAEPVEPTLPSGTGSEAAPETPAEAEAKPSLFGRIFSLLSCSYFFIQQWFIDGIVSLKRPLLENLGSVLLYILRGFEVLFALFLIMVFVAWVKQSSSGAAAAEGVTAAPAPAPAPVLFDDGVPTKEEKEYMQTA